MIKLVVSVVCVNPQTALECSLAKIESHAFDPDHAEAQIGAALDEARRAANASSLAGLRAWKPEVSISLVAEDEPVRPALHLEPHTLFQLAEAGASLDFDPYV